MFKKNILGYGMNFIVCRNKFIKQEMTMNGAWTAMLFPRPNMKNSKYLKPYSLIAWKIS